MKTQLCPSINSLDLIRTSQKYQDLSLIEIKKRILNRSGRRFSLDQKIIILKLLQYNGMNYTLTSQEVGLRRETLYKWVKDYGEFIFSIGPEYRIACDLETNLAKLQAATLQKALETTGITIDKLGELISKASTLKDIRAVSVALRSLIQVMNALLPEVREQEKLKKRDFTHVSFCLPG